MYGWSLLQKGRYYHWTGWFWWYIFRDWGRTSQHSGWIRTFSAIWSWNKNILLYVQYTSTHCLSTHLSRTYNILWLHLRMCTILMLGLQLYLRYASFVTTSDLGSRITAFFMHLWFTSNCIFGCALRSWLAPLSYRYISASSVSFSKHKISENLLSWGASKYRLKSSDMGP